jgi:hypothetical protein
MDMSTEVFHRLRSNPKTYQCRVCATTFKGFPIGRHWYCEGCRPAHYAAQRLARRWILLAIRTGRLLPASTFKCVDCKENWASGWEHRDYDRPLDVDPTCGSCNHMRGPAKFAVAS